MRLMSSKERKKWKKDKTYLRIRKADGSTNRKKYFHEYYHSDLKLGQERSAASSKPSYHKDVEKNREAAAIKSKKSLMIKMLPRGHSIPNQQKKNPDPF